MKISTETASIRKHVSHAKAIEYIAKAGFDAFDFTMTEMVGVDWKERKLFTSDSPLAGNEYLKYVRELKKVADSFGIECNQSHAPFLAGKTNELMDYFKRSLECTKELGGKICIIHPDNWWSAEENAQMYNKLLPYAKEYGVKIATENMWDWDYELDQATVSACSHHDDFLKHIKAVNDDYLVACVDLGHAEMRGLNTSAVEMIETLGSHVQALHIHDIDLHDDNHQIPFSLNIEYEPIVKALKNVGYNGYFTLEASSYLTAFDESNVFEGVKDLKNAVQRLADMFESL